MPYRHTQRSPWIVIPCLAFAALDAVIAWRSGQWALVFAVAVLIAVAIVFSSLTVEVNAGEPGALRLSGRQQADRRFGEVRDPERVERRPQSLRAPEPQGPAQGQFPVERKMVVGQRNGGALDPPRGRAGFRRNPGHRVRGVSAILAASGAAAGAGPRPSRCARVMAS